jgi:hypothetical protein
MTRDEIEIALAVGRAGLCVDWSTMDGFPGRVRRVKILKDLSIMIEFHIRDLDEGGPIYRAAFRDLDAVIQTLERYFGRPVSDWENHTRTGRYPAPPENWSGEISDEEQARFAALVAARAVPLPEGKFEQESSYWAKVETQGT